MFLRKLRNRSGSISVQIISKTHGKYKVVKTIGSGRSEQEIQKLIYLGKQEIERLKSQQGLFVSADDLLVEQTFLALSNASVRTVGPELIFGKIFDSIGFNQVNKDLFRHLVIARLAFPLSKLKTVDYLYRFQGVSIDVDSVYRFLDKLNTELKEKIEQIAFRHTSKVLKDKVSIVFYDMTTLYFEASDEDDLRKIGFSKDGKHQNPQIYLGLLVGLGGYAIGYDIFEGDIYEGHTLIPFIERISKKFNLSKPVMVADAGLLSSDNIKALQEQGYKYILGARIKSESNNIKEKMLKAELGNGQTIRIKKDDGTWLIVAYSFKRAVKDEHNRKRGLQRLEKQMQKGKLNKSHINNKGYNKYLKLKGKLEVEIDYEKFEQDKRWDGLKGYITNTRLRSAKIIENYKNLWNIERAFYGKQKIMQSDQHKSPYIHIKQALLCIITLHKYYCVVLVRVILPELKVVI